MIPLEKIVSLAKRRGFVFPGSEIYGGLANTYDYGPAGAELLRNIKNLWWKHFIQSRQDIVGIDASIISSGKVWEASGHVAGFADTMVDCKKCKLRKRADHLIEDFIDNNKQKLNANPSTNNISKEKLESLKKTRNVEGWQEDEMAEVIRLLHIPCPNCKGFDWTEVRKFNLLFPVQLGIVEGDQSLAYLRGETAQGIFINFKNVVDSTRVRLPFGIGQIGKSFRNEITLGNSIFRTIEFEQGEIEYFFDPKKSDWEKLFETWKKEMWSFVKNELGVKEENLRWRTHTDQERSFYSKKTEDLEYNFSFGFKEIWGLAYRTDYDLAEHAKSSGENLTIDDPETGEKITPHVIEPAVGINRLMLIILSDAYTEEEGRIVLKLNPKLAPYKAAVFPLLANKPELINKARSVYELLTTNHEPLNVVWDDRGNIGKRYFSQDEIGTPCCITIDFQTLEDNTVTIRDRDTTKQERIKIEDLGKKLREKIAEV